MNRAQRRAAAKRNKKNESSEVEEKMALFDKLPAECLVCRASFDKKDKSQVMTWSVVVRSTPNKFACIARTAGRKPKP